MAQIRLDHKGMQEMLKSIDVAGAVADLAEEVAATVRTDLAGRGKDWEVATDLYYTDRAATSVTIKAAGALPNEAKNGTLVRAAAAHGLEVHEHVPETS